MGIAGFFACANAAEVAPRAKARSKGAREDIEWQWCSCMSLLIDAKSIAGVSLSVQERANSSASA